MITLLTLTGTPTPCGSSGGESFHPGTRMEGRFPKRICAGCDIKDACLGFALENRTFGIWGGTTDAERRRMLRK